MQPRRVLVILRRNQLSIPHLEALGFERDLNPHSPSYRKLIRYFPRGEIGRAIALQFRETLEDAGAQCRMEFAGKHFPECTMWCMRGHHRHHTQECIRRREKRS